MTPELIPFFQMPMGFDSRIWEIVKLIMLFGLLFYLLFTVVIIRQVQLMTRTVTGELDKTIRIVAWAHFALTAGIFVMALLFL